MTREEYKAGAAKPKRNKYGNKPTLVDGTRFASQKEAKRFLVLRALEREGEIVGLKLQPRYPLTVAGHLVCTYVADFEYSMAGHNLVITEDAKGVHTPEFIIKSKLFHALYGREVRIV